MTNNEIAELQTQFVAKRNDLIREIKVSGKSYKPRELKVINYMISKIQPASQVDDYFKISIEGFIKACNLKWDEDNKWNNIVYIKKILEDIGIKKWWVKDKERAKVEHLIGWFRNVDHDEEMVSFRFDEKIYPYLFALTKDKNYTQYQLINSLQMDGKYSIRTYELLLSYFFATEKEKKIKFKIETFRELMDLGKIYPAFKDLRKNVIEPSMKDINRFANNMRVEWRVSKKAKGNKTIEIEFTMRRLTENEHADVMENQIRMDEV
jgi:plasmid replication initiation protein